MKTVIALPAVAVLAVSVTSCSSTTYDGVCASNFSNVRVSDYYCDNNYRGYSWLWNEPEQAIPPVGSPLYGSYKSSLPKNVNADKHIPTQDKGLKSESLSQSPAVLTSLSLISGEVLPSSAGSSIISG